MDQNPPGSNHLLFLTGIYSRVARQLNVHPSYVSRVARGERRSDRVSKAIASELQKLKAIAPPEDALPTDDWEASHLAAIRARRQKIAHSLRSDPRLRRLNAVILDHEDNASSSRRPPRQ